MTKEERREKFLIEYPDYIYRQRKVKRKWGNVHIHTKYRECRFCSESFRVCKINRFYCDKKCQKKYKYTSQKFKQNVRWKVWKAIHIGKLIRPKYCQNCDSHGKIEGHHYDYYKPLEVLWLCNKCHKKADKLSCA